MNRKVMFIFGSGAQGRVALDILMEQYPGIALYFVDDNAALYGEKVNGTEVIGVNDMFVIDASPGIHIAVGNPNTREQIWNRLKDAGVDEFMSAIHPSAVIMPTAEVKEGCMIGAGAIINTNAVIHRGCIVNTAAVIEHDTVMHDFSCVSPRATIGGRVHIGQKAFVASAAVILARLKIGTNAIVGMGAVVLKDVPDNKIYYGIPAVERGTVLPDFDWRKVF